MLGPGCRLLSPASVESSVLLCLLVPQSCPLPGPPSLPLPLSHHPPLGPGGVGCDPSPNVDLNLLSRARASPLAKRWGESPPGLPCSGLGPNCSVTHRGPGREREMQHCLLVGHSCSAALSLRNSSLSHPPGRRPGWGAERPGTCFFT